MGIVFQLAGPLASWGEVAPNTQRLTTFTPTRSALLGLVGSALGIDREDLSGRDALATQIEFVVETFTPGRLLIDLHTAQAGSGRGSPRTRREELAMRKISTALTHRSYREGGFWRVLLVNRPGVASRWTFEEIAEALRRPRFALFLGRRACPPMLPLAPEIVAGESVAELVRGLTAPTPPAVPVPPRCRLSWPRGVEVGLKPTLTDHRRDDPAPGVRRGFYLRPELVREEVPGE